MMKRTMTVQDQIMARLTELSRHLNAAEERELVAHLTWLIALPDAERTDLLEALGRWRLHAQDSSANGKCRHAA